MNNPDSTHPIFHKAIDLHRRNDPWIVMVHGQSHSSNYFSAQVAYFQNDFRILLIDLRGHGQSAEAAGPFGIEEHADDIAQVLDAHGVEQAHFWGTHTGAAVGLVLALRQAPRFSSLILEAAYLPGFPMPRVDALVARARSMAQSQGIPAALDDWLDHADWFAYLRAHPEACRAAAHRDMTLVFSGRPWISELTPRPVTRVSDCLARMHQPTLIYNGLHDLEDFKRAALYLNAHLSQAQLVEIPEAGGFPGWENPQVVNRVVRNFLAAF